MAYMPCPPARASWTVDPQTTRILAAFVEDTREHARHPENSRTRKRLPGDLVKGRGDLGVRQHDLAFAHVLDLFGHHHLL